jgi:hypothetical protein
VCYWLRKKRFYRAWLRDSWNWEILWNGNECGKNKVMRISSQPSPIQIMNEDKQPENVEYFRYFVAW